MSLRPAATMLALWVLACSGLPCQQSEHRQALRNGSFEGVFGRTPLQDLTDPNAEGAKAMSDFMRAYEDVARRGGPLIVRFQAFVHAARYAVQAESFDARSLSSHLIQQIERATKADEDLALRVVAESTRF